METGRPCRKSGSYNTTRWINARGSAIMIIADDYCGESIVEQVWLASVSRSILITVDSRSLISTRYREHVKLLVSEWSKRSSRPIRAIDPVIFFFLSFRKASSNAEFNTKYGYPGPRDEKGRKGRWMKVRKAKRAEERGGGKEERDEGARRKEEGSTWGNRGWAPWPLHYSGARWVRYYRRHNL